MDNKLIPTLGNTYVSSMHDLFLSQLKLWFVNTQSKFSLQTRKHFIGWIYYDDKQNLQICFHQYDWNTNKWSEYEGETEIQI